MEDSWLLIISVLDIKDIYSLSQTCNYMYYMCKESLIPSVDDFLAYLYSLDSKKIEQYLCSSIKINTDLIFKFEHHWWRENRLLFDDKLAELHYITILQLLINYSTGYYIYRLGASLYLYNTKLDFNKLALSKDLTPDAFLLKNFNLIKSIFVNYGDGIVNTSFKRIIINTPTDYISMLTIHYAEGFIDFKKEINGLLTSKVISLGDSINYFQLMSITSKYDWFYNMPF